jgi:hypothetical protein
LNANVQQPTPFTVFAAPFGTRQCLTQGSIRITALPKPVLRLSADTAILPGEESLIKVVEGRTPVTVTPAGILLKQDDSTYIFRDSVTRTFTFTNQPLTGNSTACVARTTLTITVGEFEDLYIPNLLVTKGLEGNRRFTIAGAEVKRLTIFTRWGNRVLDKENYQGDWTGQVGLYYYSAELALPTGKTQTAKGWIEVVE